MTRALTDLLAALDEQAKAELSDVEQGQRAKADRVCALARTEAERLRLSVVASAVSTAEYEAARLLADARLGAARTRRTACEQALTEVRAQVQERLAALGSTNAGTAATLALVDEALEQLPGASTVVVPANHADAVSEHLAGRTAAEVTGD
ncbi:MAG: hypothetical protein LH624_14490, partial [Cryobacterium sp.]|nr:hypothetical protein [Cryobacterium sp.]